MELEEFSGSFRARVLSGTRVGKGMDRNGLRLSLRGIFMMEEVGQVRCIQISFFLFLSLSGNRSGENRSLNLSEGIFDNV